MTETIILGSIVAVAGALSVRHIYRTSAGKNRGCSCGEANCQGSEPSDPRCPPGSSERS